MQVRMRIDAVPRGTLTMIGESLRLHSLDELASHLVLFGGRVVDELRAGSIIATGTQFLGYHPTDISARGSVPRITNIGVDEVVEVDEISARRVLLPATRYLGVATPDLAMNRLAFWFWEATQIAWFCYPLFAMNHHKRYWRELHYAPIWEARHRFNY